MDIEKYYQVSTLQALALGYSKSVITVGELLKHGNLGLGTFEDVNGEMIVMEGICYRADQNGQVTVVLDTNLTPELIELGFVRELTSKLQTMRKEAGFEVADHIRIGCQGSAKVRAVFEKYAQDIAADTLADAVSGDLSGYEKDWDVNGEAVRLSVERV